MRDDSIFLDNYNTVAYGVVVIIAVFQVSASVNNHIVPDTGAAVDNRVFNVTTFTDTDNGLPDSLRLGDFVQMLVMVGTHHTSIAHHGTFAYSGTFSNNRPLIFIGVYDATFRNHHPIEQTAGKLRWWKHPWTGKNRIGMKQVKRRLVVCKSDFGFKKRINISDIRPVPLVLVAIYIGILNCMGKQIFTEVQTTMIFQQFCLFIFAVYINSHRSQVLFPFYL